MTPSNERREDGKRLWEVRMTSVKIHVMYVKAKTRAEAKYIAIDKGKWQEEMVGTTKITANQAWYGAVES